MEIFVGIPCYKVASSITGVLTRLAAVRPDAHVIVLNDGSPDGLKQAVDAFDTSVFRSFTYKEHPHNKGYGGAQKSIFKAFQSLAKSPDDLLVFVHGDGQTAEDEIEQFIETARQYPHLDAILGSRMLNPLLAQVRAGRPLYKVLSDYILTFIQNRAYGLRLSTYASGYRAFRRKGIDKIDFSGTSNAHVFDTEALILFRVFDVKHKEIRVKVVANDTGLSANHLRAYAMNTLKLLAQHAFRYRSMRSRRFLIINADDYGYALPINEAVESALVDGTISSASLMANGAAFDDAIERAKRGGYERALGVHINLTEGTPLGTGYRTIVDHEGKLLSIAPLLRRSIAGTLDEAEIVREVELQIEKCRTHGVPISHLDTHQWSQVAPEVARAIERAALAQNIRAIRSVSERFFLHSFFGIHPRAFLNALVIALLRMRVRAFDDRIQRPRHYFGILYTGHGRLRSELLWLAQHVPPGTSELMCHIGVPGAYPSDTYYSAGRVQELEALRSPAFKGALKMRGVRTLSFAEFASL